MNKLLFTMTDFTPSMAGYLLAIPILLLGLGLAIKPSVYIKESIRNDKEILPLAIIGGRILGSLLVILSVLFLLCHHFDWYRFLI